VNRRTLIFPLSGNKIDALPVHCVPNAAHRNEGEAEMSDKEKSTDPGLTALEREKMTKTPGEVEPQKPISKAERERRKAFRQVDAKKAMTEHEIAQEAFSKNRERLKAERLKREAATPPAAKSKPKGK